MRILYVGTMVPGGTAAHRARAIERLGYEVTHCDVDKYFRTLGGLGKRIIARSLLGPPINRLNSDVIRLAKQSRPAIAWFDKPIFIRAQTIQALRAANVLTVQYNPDNPFGPRNDHSWRLFRRAITSYDIHIVPRKQNLLDYKTAGARDVRQMSFAYEPTIHFPPPPHWSDANRRIDVSFIGYPHDDRGDFLTGLWKHHGIGVEIRGQNAWHKALSEDARSALLKDGAVWGDEYRRTIWRAKINLGFITHSNLDDVAHRSFEIAACGSFLLAKRTDAHLNTFAEGTEAIYFDSVDECARMIRRYLPDEGARSRMGTAAHARAARSGYGNDERIKPILSDICNDYFTPR